MAAGGCGFFLTATAGVPGPLAASSLQGRLVLLGRQARRHRRLRLRWRGRKSRQGCSSCPLAQSPNNLLSSCTDNRQGCRQQRFHHNTIGIPGMSSDETRTTLGFSDSNSSVATIASDHRSTADVVLISSQRSSGALAKNKAAASRSWWPCFCFRASYRNGVCAVELPLAASVRLANNSKALGIGEPHNPC